MEVREPSARYLAETSTQKTEIGTLPADWSVVHLVALAEKVMVGIASAATHAYRSTGVTMFRNQNIRPGVLDTQDVLYIDPEYEQTYKNKRLKAGDLLTARTGYPGTTSLVPAGFDGAQSFTTLITRPRSGSVDPHYLCLYINGRAGQRYFEQAQIGGGQKNVNAASLKLLPVALPGTRSEQRAIADALTDADALIESLEQLLTKKRQIKQGAMQELLTGKRRLPGFSGPWSDGVLGNVVAELVAGVSVNSDPSESSADVPSVVKTSAMKAGVFDPSECKPIIQADLARATTTLRKDTLLISRMNTPDLVGEVGYVDRNYDELFLPDRIWMTRMRSPDCVCVRWLGYLLSSAPYKQRIGDTATGTSGSMKNIAKSALLGILVSFPGVDEQQAIAQVLSDMDAEITALESRLTKARALKQAMAQALLTGRIRLVEPTA